MIFTIAAIFVVTYVAIALEHPLRIEKAASALAGAGLLWTVYALSPESHDHLARQLDESLSSCAAVIFFLMGAMTIVEVIDAHDGFEIVTSRIRTRKLGRLMWLICFITFFLSAALDNLTTTIVMVSLAQKILDERNDRLLFVSMIVIAANAGGAWSPIGDVTTTMLWIGGQVTPLAVVKSLFAASLVNMLLPLLIVVVQFKDRTFARPAAAAEDTLAGTPPFERKLMFFLGLGILVLVPAFKGVTHLPPFMGILFGLGILWLVGEIIHRGKRPEAKEHLTVAHALTQIDMNSIVFFVGILLAVATLEHAHILSALAGSGTG